MVYSYNFAAGSFHTKKLCSRLFSTEVEIYWKIAKSRFVPPFGGLRGNVHGSSMAHRKAHGRLPSSANNANWTFFASSYGWSAMSKYWSKLRCLKGGGSHWAQISGEGGSSTDEFWRQKTRIPGLSRGVVCVILRLAVLIQYRRVTHTHTHTDRQTDTRTHDDGYYPRIAICRRAGKKSYHTAHTILEA